MDNYDAQVDVARKIFLEYDQQLLIRKFRLQADAQYLYLTYLNTPSRISRKTGSIEQYTGKWQECREYSRVMTVYDLLCYHKGESLPELSGQWCTVGTFIIAGITDTETYTGKIASLFDGHVNELKKACEKLGGEILKPMANANVTCRIPVTAFFSVLLQFWEGDEEFPPKLLILWDRNTDKFLHFETTFYLQGDLLDCLKEQKNGRFA